MRTLALAWSAGMAWFFVSELATCPGHHKVPLLLSVLLGSGLLYAMGTMAYLLVDMILDADRSYFPLRPLQPVCDIFRPEWMHISTKKLRESLDLVNASISETDKSPARMEEELILRLALEITLAYRDRGVTRIPYTCLPLTP